MFRCEPLFVFLLASVLWLRRCPVAPDVLDARAAPDVPDVPLALTQTSRIATNALPVSAKRTRPLHPCRNPPCSARCTSRAHPNQPPSYQRSPCEREAHMVPRALSKRSETHLMSPWRSPELRARRATGIS